MGAVDWQAAKDWVFQPGVIVPAGLALIAGAYKLGTRRTDRRDRREERRAEERRVAEVERLRSEAQLDATHATFGALLRVPHGPGTGRPQMPPVEIEAWTAGVWIYEVRLSWRYNTDDEGDWRLKGAPCGPFERGSELPSPLSQTEGMGFDWPGAPLPEPQALSWTLEIEWGVARTGGTRTAIVHDGSTSWQEA